MGVSLEKAFRIFDNLGNAKQPLSLKDLSIDLRLPKSTVHHLLQTALQFGYVTQDNETRKYSLGIRFVQLSSRFMDNVTIVSIAHPYLLKLAEETGEVAHLYILRSGKAICVDKVGRAQGLSLSSYVGWTTDPHPSAAGKVLLSEMPKSEIVDAYGTRGLTPYGKNTITDFNALWSELAIIRKQGYGIDDEEYYEGIRCVGAPIRVMDRIVASLSLTGSIFTMTMKRINHDLINLVVETAKIITTEANKISNFVR